MKVNKNILQTLEGKFGGDMLYLHLMAVDANILG